MNLYRKKPVVITAVQWNGDISEIIAAFGRGFEFGPFSLWLRIPTLEGDMTAQPGDWIIRGVKGEYYPCKPDIFETTYEPVEGEVK